jgi:hypothetical protein
MNKYNPHKRCGCNACRHGAGSPAGQAMHRAINRKLRRLERLDLRTQHYDEVGLTRVSTPYTD